MCRCKAHKGRHVVLLEVAAVLVGSFGRTGLTRHVIAVNRAANARSLGHDRLHARCHLGCGVLRNRALAFAPVLLVALAGLIEVRGHHHAAVGDAAHGTCDLNRRDGQRLSKAHRTQRGAVILVTLLDDAQALARKIDTGAVTYAPLVHIGGKVIRTDLAPHQDKAHVGRTAHHLAHIHGHGIVALVGIGDGIVTHLDARRHLKRRTRSHDAQVEAGARHERLKDRAGLVGVGDQAQVHILGLGVFQIGLVVGRVRAGGENFTSRGVGDQSRAVLGLCLLDSLRQSILSRSLHIDVERRHDVNAVDRSHLFIGTARDIAAVPRALAHEGTIRAGQKLVVLLFETRQAVVVYIHYTQHLRCQIAVWIYALHGLLKKHAGQGLRPPGA